MPPELTPKQKKTLERLAKVVEGGGVAILENLLETEQKVEEALQKVNEKVLEISQKFEKTVEEVKATAPDFKQVLEQVKGKDGRDGESIVGPQGPAGKDGEDGKTIVGPQGPTGEDGKNGQSIVGPAGKDGKDADEKAIQERIEKNLPSLGVAMRDGLELLHEGEKLKIEAIENLRKELDELKKRPMNSGPGAISGREFVIDIDISSQFDGVLKTFNTQAVWKIISVDLSSSPFGSLRKNTDYTWTPTSITFTSQIDAATQLAAGQSCVITAVI